MTHKGDPERIMAEICESMREYLEKKGVPDAANAAAAKCAEVRSKRNATDRPNNTRKLTREEIQNRYLSLIMRGPHSKSYHPGHTERRPGGARHRKRRRVTAKYSRK